MNINDGQQRASTPGCHKRSSWQWSLNICSQVSGSVCPCGGHAPRPTFNDRVRRKSPNQTRWPIPCWLPLSTQPAFTGPLPKNNTTCFCPPTRSRPRVTTSARSAALSASDRVRSSRKASFAALHAARSTRSASCDARSASCGPGCHKSKTTHVTDSTRPLAHISCCARCPLSTYTS
jgi:hypothetical protein